MNNANGITNLVNKIKIYTNLIELFHFEIYVFLFLSKYVIIFGKITWINVFIITQKKMVRICMFSFITKIQVENNTNNVQNDWMIGEV